VRKINAADLYLPEPNGNSAAYNWHEEKDGEICSTGNDNAILIILAGEQIIIDIRLTSRVSRTKKLSSESCLRFINRLELARRPRLFSSDILVTYAKSKSKMIGISKLKLRLKIKYFQN